MFRYLREDIRAVFDRDPAARSSWEVLTCYPGIHALIMHRLAHWLWGHRLRWLARFTAHLARFYRHRNSPRRHDWPPLFH